MGQLILVRSGKTEYDEQDRIAGNLDLPLTISGEAEIADLADELKESQIEAIYTSATQSAEQSAQIIGERLGLPVKSIKGLENIDLGLWQGLENEELKRKHPRLFKHWQQAPKSVHPPNGESIEEATQRIAKSLHSTLKRISKSDRSVLLVMPEPIRTLTIFHLNAMPWDEETIEAHWPPDSTRRYDRVELS